MKKLFTFFVVVLFAASLMAQQITNDETFRYDGYAPVNHKAMMQKLQTHATKELPIGWMIPSWNLLDYFWMSTSAVTHYANVIFPDSTVTYESGGTTYYNWFNSIGGVFDPYSEMYDSLQLFPLLNTSQPYRIDSIFVLAWYNVVASSVTDTLAVELVTGDPTVDTQFVWTVFNFPSDTFNVSPPKVMGSTTQAGYLCRMTAPSKTVIKYPLKLTDSTNSLGKTIVIPVNYNVPAGKVTGVSITYIPGMPNLFGELLFSYSHTGTPALNSIRIGLYSTNDAVADPFVFADPYLRWNSHHYINTNIRYSMYTGGNAWRNERMASTMSWGFDMGYYITNTTPGAGISETSIGGPNIYPNPTDGLFYIENAVSGSRLKILDILGNCLIDKIIDNTKQSVDIGALQSGFYFVEIGKDNQSFTYKIVLNR